MALFRALSHRSFALLWSGQIISRLGDSLFTFALAWWVLQKTGSATAMGIVLICSTVPMLLLLLFGGVAVDRFPRVRLMLVSDLLCGGVVLLIAYLSFQQQLVLWQIFVMSALFGIVEAFFSPAYTALVPDLVPSELLPSANSLRSINLQAAQLIGPAIAAGMIALGGTSLAFALDGVSFILSAACLVALPRVETVRQPVEKEASVLQDASFGVLGLSWMNTLQDPTFVSPDMLGRVASIDLFVSTGLLPIGYGLAAIAADRFGAPLIFILGGAIAASVIALGLLHPAIRAVD
jgi:MFS family permease